jgi:hypothetical protein
MRRVLRVILDVVVVKKRGEEPVKGIDEDSSAWTTERP